MTDSFFIKPTQAFQRGKTIAVVPLAFALVLLLTACQTTPKADPLNAKSASAKLGGGLVVVRLLNRVATPRAVVLEVTLAGQQESTAISGRVQQSVPGQFSDYLVPLALPPGSYVLKSLRGSEAAGGEPAGVLAELDLPLTFSEPDPVYLGRLVVRSKAGIAARQDLSIEDKFDEDTLAFRTAVPELRKAGITRSVLDALLISSARPGPSTHAGGRMEVALIDGESATRLAEPARSAFARYMQTATPRAFASSASGSYGYSSGSLAVATALKNCAKRAKASPGGRTGTADCQLFSVDQILLTAESCKAGTDETGGTPTLRAGCAATPRKNP